MTFTDVVKEKKEKFVVDKPGKHIFFLFNYSGKIQIEIRERDVEAYIFGLYLAKGSEQFKLESVQHHRVGESVSDLLIKGVFFDQAKFIYQGMIRIEKKAQKSNAYQKNQNLVLSKEVFVDSRPFLEILANDVRCTHGSTIGRLNQDQLYYLQTRGLRQKKAERLLIEGFISDVFDRIERLDGLNYIKRYREQVNRLLSY